MGSNNVHVLPHVAILMMFMVVEGRNMLYEMDG